MFTIKASKLDKLSATGRFGLGFNSVYHFTDVPSFVSGEHLVMFDPHTKYVPGASSVQPGIKVGGPCCAIYLQYCRDRHAQVAHYCHVSPVIHDLASLVVRLVRRFWGVCCFKYSIERKCNY